MVVGLGEGSVRQTMGGGDIHLIRPLDGLAIMSWPQSTFYEAGGGGCMNNTRNANVLARQNELAELLVQ